MIQTPVLTGPPGPSGATGPTGPTGATGATGATGPLITANNARITNTPTQTIAAGADIPLSTNALINETAISHVPGSTDIVLAPNQTYFVTYEAESSVGTNGLASLELQLNGVIVGGTQSRVT
ncbi:hypothetical protein [Bacillus thuringiensis]|uniref:hypothetical protein n=1 Tax=Bacillus thuringiensis TaxID=1428 RepID=UPI00197AE4BF|nr:hypothetical protein [Bacillus thuringiensis]